MLVVFTRAIIVYMFLVASMRLMGKRQLGELQPFEFSITLIVAELACIPMTETSIPIAYGIIPMFTMFILHLTITKIAKKSMRFSKVFNGKPIIIVDQNGVDYEMLEKVDLSIADLMEAIRSNGYFDLSQVAFAILETNGSMSVLPKNANAPLTPETLNAPETETEQIFGLIYDGKIMSENIEKSKKTERDISDLCAREKCKIKDVLFLFSSGDDIYFQSKYGKAKSLKWSDGYQKSEEK